MKMCVLCGRTASCTHHLVFGMSLRFLADEDGLVIPLCDSCHNIGDILSRIHGNTAGEKLSKVAGQLMYERNRCAEGATLDEARRDFMKRYGRSYI